ncbi:type VI secretion system membrane subunit TssM [Methylobacter psychrophilus]|uniref:hypothetical protein n=1 Tax=Methylobacter psychrophilus TaxID=96941 RepID=UPI0021D50D56|nr:hypothetical protein [Methylobacter psychrophilus]
MPLNASMNKFDTVISVLSWLDWVGLAVVLLLSGILAWLIWQRKYAKGAGKPAIQAITVPVKLLLASNCLSTVWRGFVGAIPWRLRSGALSVPLSLVIGDAGSGKTGIIDRYGHWEGQDFRFHPSAIDDPLLQIYLGDKSLVLEFCSSLLYDTSSAAYHAIKKLWRHLPPRPQAVMVIDATTLLTPKTELLRQSGQALFGKLQAFGELERKPLPLILALSHMEKIEGFVEFCIFLEEAGIPLQIDFPQMDGINQLASCLDGFQQHLPRALVTRPAQDYLKIVAFLNTAPRLLGVLVEFLRVAGLEQGLASPPVVRLCLLSEQVNSFGCQPFSLHAGIVDKPRLALNGHSKTALILLLAGAAYLIVCYRYQQVLQTKIYQGIQTISATPVEHYAENIGSLFFNPGQPLSDRTLLLWRPLQPTYFKNVDNNSKHLLIGEIRKYYLLPLLKQIQFEQNATFKTNRLIGLLYSTSTNEIGKLIWANPQLNPIDMDKYGALVKDYIMYNSDTDDLDNALNQITYTQQSYVDDHLLWLMLFHKFKDILKRPFVQEAEFKELQQELVPFLGIIDQLNFYNQQPEITQWLVQHTNLRRNARAEFDNQSGLDQKSIGQLLGLVSNLKLSNTDNCDVTLSLKECLELIQELANAKTDTTSPDMVFSLDGEYFSFTRQQWVDLIKRSRVIMRLRSLINNHRNYDGWVFFNSPSTYTDVEMNSSNNGGMLFAGKARIDGRLTADAFEQYVKPAIMGLSDIVAKLPIDANEKKYFGDFVIKNLSTYSDRYVSSYLNYFRQFQVRIDSTWGLNYVLDDLQQPNSQLLETLVQIKNNTALNLPTSPNFEPLAQKLAVFRFIQRLMEEKNGVYPEFQKYQLMMAQMQYEIDSTEPYVPKKSDDNAASLKGALTPIGRVAWAMRAHEDGSYSTLVKNWLQNAGILNNWQQPFLAPVQKVEEFGTAEINQNIAGIWSDIWDSNVAPLLVKFPFTPNAGRDQELAMADLVKIFHPKQGIFWVTFQQYLSPLASLGNGVWVKRHDLSDSVVLPANYLYRLNAAQQLTANLWDGQGNPKPLELSVKPGLLPTFDSKQIPQAPLVSLSYLRKGGVSVLGFNQQADWQKLSLEWWILQPAEVGMEFRKDADPTQVYTDITVADSPWNFFRLLQQGQVTGSQNYRWKLAHPDFPQQPLNLEFSFQANPLAIFTNLAGS